MSKFLAFDFEYEHDYTLIGIHSTLEDYRLAFFLNQNLNIQLSRSNDDLDFSQDNCKFPFYIYDDENNFTDWSLISNKHAYTSSATVEKSNLFGEESKISYLIPEKKQVDYFIKISGNIPKKDVSTILAKINQTYQIITSYTLDPYSLKSKDNLIF